MIIDFHTHTFPDRIAATALTKMQQDGHIVAFTNGTMDALKQSMKNAGIDHSVVLPVATNPLKVSAINDLSIRLTQTDGLIYFGCIHPDMEDAMGELERIAAAGIRGIKIHPVYQGTDIDDIQFLRILDKAAELGLIVVMHAGDDIGFPGVVRCSPEMTRHALQQVGDVTLIVAHMGGWKNWDRVCSLLADTKVYIDTAFSLGRITPLDDHYTDEELALMSATQFCQTVRRFGSERVLFGTDSPWTDQKQSLEDIRALPLTAQEMANILSDNARRLLSI